MTMSYKPAIGLEIHVELKTKSKMFCGCPNDPGEKRPNFNICPICSGHPGTLPVANEEAIKKVIKTGLVLHCKIAKTSKFDRKNYFYPDLPKGYQISQYDQPLCQGGYLDVDGRKIKIRRVHLEEDTGRLLHPEGVDYSLVDFNRAGVPLMELVTEPDITSGQEAKKFAEEFQLILKYLGVSDADMEKGLMRIEVNISSSKGKTLGTKVEIKNLNSFKVVEKAIYFEIERQAGLLEKRENVVQETRGWHDKKEITFSQRGKEEARDYRYFPEPDLPPLNFDKAYIEKIKSEIPELPKQRRKRFAKEYGLDKGSIDIFVANKDLGEYYEKVVSELEDWIGEKSHLDNSQKTKDRKIHLLAANYLISDVLGLLQGRQFSEKKFRITPENFAEFVKMIFGGEISSKIAKMVLVDMFNTGSDPSAIVDENNWQQMQDEKILEKIVKEVIAKNQKAVQDYKSGKKNSLQFLAGQAIAATRGTANPKTLQKILREILN